MLNGAVLSYFIGVIVTVDIVCFLNDLMESE